MKAIFVVSALAAAISAQALAADTESTTTFTGGVKVEATYNIDGESNSFDKNGDDTKLEGSIAVANGPFSGTIKITDGDEIEVKDLKVDNGVIAFGSIGSIVTTEKPVEGMAANAWSVDQAFRYTNADLGLKIQVEEGNTERKGDKNLNAEGPDGILGTSDDDTDTVDEVNVCTDSDVNGDIYDHSCEDKKEWEQVLDARQNHGVTVAYAQEFGVATVNADLQYRTTGAKDAKADAMYYGVKVVATPVEMLTLTAGYNSGRVDEFQTKPTDTLSSYGVQADVKVVEGVTAYASYADKDGDTKTRAGVKAVYAPVTATADWTADDKTVLKLAATQAFDATTVSGYVSYEMPASGDASFEAQGKVAYAFTDMTSAYAQATSRNGDSLELIANVTHKLEDGISLSATYENDNKPDSGNDKDGNDFKHEIKFAAAYSF